MFKRLFALVVISCFVSGCSSCDDDDGQTPTNNGAVPDAAMPDGGSGAPDGADCTANSECASGFCQAGVCTSDPSGDACGSVYCADDERCDGTTCVPDEGEECDAPCGETCCGELEECVEGSCMAPCPDGPRCMTDDGPICCGSEQGCVFDKCVDLGDTCDAENPCPFTHFCEPTLNRCVDANEDPTACLYMPPIGEFTPEEAFRWSSSTLSPDYDQVMATPVVGNLTDDNGDGVIDTNDVPDIVFTTFHRSGAYNSPGPLRVISGDDGREHWSSADLPAPFQVHGSGTAALGDIDGDGVVEIVIESGGGVIAVEHDGVIKWSQPSANGNRYGGPAIANIDGAGGVEIVTYRHVLNAEGEIVCALPSGTFAPAVADLDLDGKQEIIHGESVYRLTNPAATDGSGCLAVVSGIPGYPAVANFDDDPQPEVVTAHSNGDLVLRGHTGDEVWRVTLPIDQPRIQATYGIADCSAPPAGQACASSADCGGGPCYSGICYPHKACHPGGGPPTIADFDGDRQPEIGIAARWYYLVFESDGSVLWAHKTQDFSSAVTGSSVFDFEGDGRAEVVYNDELNLRVYSGAGSGMDEDGDGFADPVILLEIPNSSGTLAEYPLIVDVDNDGNAEIVVAANNYGGQATYSDTHGIRVFKDANDNWVGTRPIWNQHSYHVTNVEEDGTIPTQQANNWEVAGLNNFRQNVQGGNPFNAPNLTANVQEVSGNNCTTAGLVINFEIRNEGSLGVPAGALDATIYAGEAGTELAAIDTVQNTMPLAPGGAEAFEYTWSVPQNLYGKRVDVRVVADDDGTGGGRHNECVEDDNAGELLDTLCMVPQ